MKTSTKTKNDLIDRIDHITEDKIIYGSSDKYPKLRSLLKNREDDTVYNRLIDVCRFNDNALNELINYFNTYFKEEVDFKSLDKEAKTWCLSTKWKKGHFKFTSFSLGKYMINLHYVNKINVHEAEEKEEKFTIVSDFTIFLLLVFYYRINPNDINVYVDSDFEVWLYKYFGIVDENIHKVKNWNNIGSEIMPKHFDVLFSNPPYNGSIDLHIIDSLIENKIADEMIIVHPTTFLFSEKLRKYIKNINVLKKVYMFFGNHIFNIGLDNPLCISTWKSDKKTTEIEVEDTAINKEKYIANSIEDIHMLGSHYMTSFIEKVEKFMKKNFGSIISQPNNINHKTYAGMNGYLFAFNTRSGTPPKDNNMSEDYWTLVTKNINEHFVNSNFRYHACFYDITLWNFNTPEERINFYKTCETKFYRYCLALCKNQRSLMRGRQCRLIPWMKDYTHAYTDEDFIKLIGLTKEEWNHIEATIPDYYDNYQSEIRGNINDSIFA